MKKADVKSRKGGCWFYSDTVKEHFMKPRNFITDKDVRKYKSDGVGQVGSPACGDVMRMWIKVDKSGKVKDCKWQTFGCASAIASTSMFSTMIKGKKIETALKITPRDIVNKLGGLPEIKFHCSVLADQAFKAAVKNYREKSN